MPFAEFQLEDGAKVVVEVDQPLSGDIVRVSRGEDGLLKATQTLESALAGIKGVAGSVLKVVKELGPAEAEVELGFKLSAESGVILAKTGGEAHVQVKLTWKK
jgi:hypothetical protein